MTSLAYTTIFIFIEGPDSVTWNKTRKLYAERATFIHADPIYFLETTSASYQVATLNLCNWYLTSPKVLEATFRSLYHRVETVYIAEWDMRAFDDPTSHAYNYAFRAQRLLAKHEPWLPYDVFTMFTPDEITAAAVAAGFSLVSESTIHPDRPVGIGKIQDLSFFSGPGERLDRLLPESDGHPDRQEFLDLRTSMLASHLESGSHVSASPRVWLAQFGKTSS